MFLTKWKKLVIVIFYYFVLPLEMAIGGYGLPGGYPKQYHNNELFITLFNSSYVPGEGYYDPKCAAYFSKDGINNLQYYPSNKTTSVRNFLRRVNSLGMNGVVWVPEFWVRRGFGERDYEQWVRKSSGANLFAWFMPDELPIAYMRANAAKNPIYDPTDPKLRDPKNPKIPWFFNENNPDAKNTVIGQVRWFAKRIRNEDRHRHIMISPGNGRAMTDLNRWVTTIENLSEYCDIWLRVAYPNWLNRSRTMLIYEFEQWVICRDKARANGTNVDDLYFMLLLESFKVPWSNPVNYIPPEIIRFDAYASLTLGSQGLIWWNGKEWNNPAPGAQAMYKAIKSVAREINIPYGVHLAPCLLADEPEQYITAAVVTGPAKAPTYRGREYDSVQVRLKQEGSNGPMYLFAANFAEKWDKESYRRANERGSYKCKDPNVGVRFSGFENQPHWAEVVVDSRDERASGWRVPIDNSCFEDSFAGLTARVYKLLLQPNVSISVNGIDASSRVKQNRDGIKTIKMKFASGVKININDIEFRKFDGASLTTVNFKLDYDPQNYIATVVFDVDGDGVFGDSLKGSSLKDGSKLCIRMNINGIRKVLNDEKILKDLDNNPNDCWYEVCLKPRYVK